MLEALYKLLGSSLESEAIKKLFADWEVAYPTKITCTPNNDTVKTKMKKEGVLLYFRAVPKTMFPQMHNKIFYLC